MTSEDGREVQPVRRELWLEDATKVIIDGRLSPKEV
jgi:hypothetical protein